MKTKTALKITIVIAVIMAAGVFLKKNSSHDVINVGYFHGGRTMLLYRALVNNYFEKEGLSAYFYTKQLRTNEWKKYDNTGDENTFLGRKAGKATGIELTDLLLSGKVDVSFIGEAAFLKACSQGKPILAVAQLGWDEAEEGGHSIVIKKGIKINGPKDLERITWGTRRSSGGDDIFLKEFLYKEGADLSKIKIISGIDDDKISRFLKEGKIQGAYHHLMMVRNDEEDGFVYTYRKLDWVNPNMSQAIAVVTNDYFKSHQDILRKFIRGYMKRIAYERSLPEEERRKKVRLENNKGYKVALYEMEMNYKGMNLPQYPAIPIIRKDLMDEAIVMFSRHKFIEGNFQVEKCYNNSLVVEVGKELYPNQK